VSDGDTGWGGGGGNDSAAACYGRWRAGVRSCRKRKGGLGTPVRSHCKGGKGSSRAKLLAGRRGESKRGVWVEKKERGGPERTFALTDRGGWKVTFGEGSRHKKVGGGESRQRREPGKQRSCCGRGEKGDGNGRIAHGKGCKLQVLGRCGGGGVTLIRR